MNNIKKKPNFFIIGSAKAGTTSLYNIIDQHPDVYFPFVKEPSYFSDEKYYKRGDQWYLDTFFCNAKNEKLRGEATTNYLYFGKKVAPRIEKFSESVTPKFIVLFRDPVKLVYSFYWHSVREGHEKLPFDEALQIEEKRMVSMKESLEKRGRLLFSYSKIGEFARQLDNYLDYFPTENFLFLLTEDLSNFNSLINKVQDFLEIDDYSKNIIPVRSNVSAMPKSRKIHQFLRKQSFVKEIMKPLLPYKIRYNLKEKAIKMNLKRFSPPSINPAVENHLKNHYKEQTLKLQDIIQRDLSSWLSK